MTSARTRIPADPLMRISGACAFILFVIVVILPH
jgi:hypothetical protein